MFRTGHGLDDSDCHFQFMEIIAQNLVVAYDYRYLNVMRWAREKCLFFEEQKIK